MISKHIEVILETIATCIVNCLHSINEIVKTITFSACVLSILTLVTILDELIISIKLTDKSWRHV